ncbi:MAG: ABC transporter ATP-binding protein [Chloroflexota bacterium]
MGALGALRPYLWRYKRDLGLGVVFSIAVYAVALVGPWLLRLAIDSITSTRAAADPWLLARYALLMAGAAALANVFSFLQHWRLFLVGNRVEFDYRNDFFRHLQSLDAAFFQERKTGDLVSLATNDLAVIRTLVGAGSINFLNTTVALLSGLSLMFLLDAHLALYTLLILPCMTLVYVVLARPNRRRFERMQDQYGVLSSLVQENIAGARVVKAYAQEDAQIRAFGRQCQEYRRRAVSYMRLSGLLSPLMYVIFGIAVLVLLLIGGGDVIAHRITLGELIQFNGYLMMLNWPVVALGWLITILGQAEGAMGRLQTVQHRQPIIADGAQTLSVERLEGGIRFAGVSLTLNGTPILHDISLEIPTGTSLAIVGPIGSGKSSLINLLLRMYDPREGQISIDGIDLRMIPLETLRRHIGYVPQETFLFSETLAENILYGLEEQSPAAARALVAQASATARLDRDVAGVPLGYETVLGERGVTLSGGQKQRAAIARALAKDPRILILDDALSAVDTHTEDEILTGLREVMRDRTSIVVSHRVSTVRHCDRIVVLEGGRIVEEGTHRGLIARGGQYAEMYRRQLLAQEMEEGTTRGH